MHRRGRFKDALDVAEFFMRHELLQGGVIEFFRLRQNGRPHVPQVAAIQGELDGGGIAPQQYAQAAVAERQSLIPAFDGSGQLQVVR